ncbi:hypothetical protein [Piscinibacter terrae]|uniref:Uncharacterized protein n=1 Tax=Piscinibacter terrae TaxID=2496871 RepID=A0A3N7JXJ4_9BURK|nr:hypothetical protein [Albitalea terrae]RQP23615.1 hypothetical protein DZC73_15865 [Albitalea terrae]
MKVFTPIIASLILVASASAQSATINLGGDACGNTRQCADVPNDANAEISFGASTTYQTAHITINGKTFSGPATVTETSVEGVLYATDGTWVQVSSQWSYIRKQINNGRAHYWVTNYTLTGGAVVTG